MSNADQRRTSLRHHASRQRGLKMETTGGDTWADFEDWVAKLMSEHRALKTGANMGVSTLVFRGQSDATWCLKTTLERYPGATRDALGYFRAIDGVKSSIESLTGQRWDLPTQPEFSEILARSLPFGWGEIPGYDYMVHLRHHGFPTPLLDWSRSPFVAAFFAFNHALRADGRVAIYAFVEYAGGGKGSSSAQGTIHGLGPHVTTHRRHVLQQAEYTICTQLVDGKWAYSSHDDALLLQDPLDDQDRLWKFTLPASIRESVLQRLDLFNLNAFSLFPSEESLMDTMALRAFVFDKD